MNKLSSSRFIALFRAAHFGPTVLVVTTTFLISIARFPLPYSLQITIAIFFGQLVVGWSNDLIDFPLDQEAKRVSKPLVSGDLQISLLRKFLGLAIIFTLISSLIAPWGFKGALIHVLGVLIAIAYNLKLKSTIFSPLPYLLAFGGLPWAIYAGVSDNPPTWLYCGLALFSTAFHFLNVIKDLEWDLPQGVLGLPQRIGRSKSIFMACACSLLAVVQGILLY